MREPYDPGVTQIHVSEVRSTRAKAGLPGYRRGWARIIGRYGNGPGGIGGIEHLKIQWPDGAQAYWPIDDGMADIHKRYGYLFR
jgi:hypothetical protein